MRDALRRAAGLRPRHAAPSYPSPSDLLRGELTEKERGELHRRGYLTVRGGTTGTAYQVAGYGNVSGYCVQIEEIWYEEAKAAGVDDDYRAGTRRRYYEAVRLLAVKALIEHDEALFKQIANSSRTTRLRNSIPTTNGGRGAEGEGEEVPF